MHSKVDTESIRRRVVEVARSMVGTPWRHQGRNATIGKWGGIDCAGLIVLTGRAAGVLPEDAELRGYRRSPDGRTMIALLSKWGTRVSEPRPGDVAALVVRGAQVPQHLGIISELPDGRLGLIHACARHRRVVENSIGDRDQLTRIIGYWSFRALEE
jgi:cell wall-associated NlpC family hydrolase